MLKELFIEWQNTPMEQVITILGTIGLLTMVYILYKCWTTPDNNVQQLQDAKSSGGEE